MYHPSLVDPAAFWWSNILVEHPAKWCALHFLIQPLLMLKDDDNLFSKVKVKSVLWLTKGRKNGDEAQLMFLLCINYILFVCTGCKNLCVFAELENWVRDCIVGVSDRIKLGFKFKSNMSVWVGGGGGCWKGRGNSTDCSWHLWRQVMTAIIPLDELFTPSVILVLDLKQHKSDKLQHNWIIFSTTIILLVLYQPTNYTKSKVLFFNISCKHFYDSQHQKHFKSLAILCTCIYTCRLSSPSFKLTLFCVEKWWSVTTFSQFLGKLWWEILCKLMVLIVYHISGMTLKKTKRARKDWEGRSWILSGTEGW